MNVRTFALAALLLAACAHGGGDKQGGDALEQRFGLTYEPEAGADEKPEAAPAAP